MRRGIHRPQGPAALRPSEPSETSGAPAKRAGRADAPRAPSAPADAGTERAARRFVQPSAASVPDRRPPRLNPNPFHWLGRVTHKAVMGAALGALLLSGCAAHKQLGHTGPVAAPGPVAQVETSMLGEGAPLHDLRWGDAREVESARPLSAIDPAGALDAVESGQVVLRIPLEPGEHRVRGKRFSVRPGTHLEVGLQVEGGQVLPSDASLTGVRVVPAIDGPLWTTARGVYLETTGPGRGQLLVDVGGWADAALDGERGLDLASFVESFASAPSGGSGSMLRLDETSFRVDDLRFAPGNLSVGGLELDLAEGNRGALQGDLRSMRLEGEVRIRGGEVSGDGLALTLGPTTVDLELSTQTVGEQTRVTARADELDTRVPRLSAADGRGSALELRDARITGTLETISTWSGLDRGPAAGTAAFSGHVDAQVPSARFTIPDDDGGARVSFSADRVHGALTAGGGTLAVDGRLEGARLEVADLERAGRLALERGHLEGDARLRLSAGGALSAEVDARDIDLRITDYRSADGATDLGATEVRGQGRAELDGAGLRVSGDLEVTGAIDDLRGTLGGEQRFDVAAGSHYAGRLRRLEVPTAATAGDPVLEGRVELALTLEDAQLDLPGATLAGRGRLTGPADVHLEGGRLQLSDADARLEVTARDGRLAALDRLELDMAAGSRALLRVRSATLGADAPALELGPGSELELRLDGGHLRVAGRDVQFEPGTFALFEIDRLSLGEDGLPELVGSLEIDSPLDLDAAPAHLRVPNRPDIGGPSAAGVRIEQVRLRSDGSFALDGLDLHLDTRTGDVSGVRAGDRRRLAPLLAARPELRTHQDLINHFYRVGGGEWAGASRAAAAYGLELSALAETREADARTHVPEDGLGAEFATQALDIPSLETVRASSPEALAGVEIAGGELDPWALASSVTDGTLRVEIPVEGTHGRWPESVSFEPGTVLSLELEVEAGELRGLEVDLSDPGDAFLWTELRGAYLDDDRNLRLDISGWPDSVVPGLGALPTELGPLVERLRGLTDGAAPRAEGSVLQLDRATIALEGASVAPGTTLQLPFGSFEIADGTTLRASGGGDRLEIGGTLELDDWALSAGGLAVDADRARATAQIEVVPREGGGWDARLVFDELDGAIRNLAFKHGDNHVALGAGEVGGRIEIHVSEDGAGDSRVVGDVDLRRFDGDVRSMRFVGGGEGDDDPARFELGPSHLDGRFRVRPTGAIELSGRAEGMSGALRNISLQTVDGPLHVADARFDASAYIDYRPGQLVALDGQLRGSAVLAAEPRDLDLAAGLFEDLQVDGGRAVVDFDLEHFEELSHGEGRPLVLDALEGHLGGSGRAEHVEGRLGPR